MILKPLVFFIIIVAANNAETQNNQQQKNLGKILNDQKLWQQSKMPTKTIYNNNSSYKVPLFPRTAVLSRERASLYMRIKPCPKRTKQSLY